MNRNEIEDMAREAGFGTVDTRILERFAALVAAAEREACALVAERFLLMHSGSEWDAVHCADAIRARGEE